MKNSRLTVRSVTAAALIGAALAGFGGGVANAADNAPGLYGNPDQATKYWVRQTLDDCSLMATADVVGQLTGDQPSEDEIVALAGATPSAHHDGVIYLPPANPDDPDSGNGTDSHDLPILLAHYGIGAVYTDDDVADATGVPTGMDALEHVLGAGKKVIAGVNAETIWDEHGDRTIGDHDLVVTGVDTDARIVHLNDSGTDDGADEQVPIDVFETAWQASGHDMVITG
ncbi:hypothetical protein [Mycobacterium sp. 236(2023)]|uniref:hypothetical protein n=1 Tax=Mycobacterium sp. 236(2023) TaxID=3038163 RepID=UPI0024157C97|nr:hypothetical protein [Mycobacterium sp. 236(2023)]MDG4667578.1 hypothetical protein [Mycobacterium sp. 236(2023)]